MDGFADSLPAIKTAIPGRKKYSLPSLATDVLERTYNAHDAGADVDVLKRLVNSKVSTSSLLKHSCSM